MSAPFLFLLFLGLISVIEAINFSNDSVRIKLTNLVVNNNKNGAA